MEQKRQLRIVAKTWETPDTATFTLQPADGLPFHYKPGQYLSLVFENISGEKRRAYSFCTCPGVDKFPAITVKRIPNGEFSNWLLYHTKPGDLLTAADANGRFLLPEKQPDTIFYIVAGSGITPAMSHLKWLLFSDRVTSSHPVTKPNTIQIFDNHGKLIFQQQYAGSETAFLPADIFPAAGIYFYKITGAQTQTGKLVFAP
jgi:ferredoxin-NADP reductase